MIYSPRAQPEVNESHIHEVPKNNWLIFPHADADPGEVKWVNFYPPLFMSPPDGTIDQFLDSKYRRGH